MKDKRERPNIKPMITFNGDFKKPESWDSKYKP